MGWMEELGLKVRMDTVGNIYGRYEGTENLPAIYVDLILIQCLMVVISMV